MENVVEEAVNITKNAATGNKDSDTIKKLEKVEDFWSAHNFGTRISLIVFMISFLSIVIAGFFGVIMPAAVINMVFYSAIIAYATVTLGINGIKIILDGIAQIKTGAQTK